MTQPTPHQTQFPHMYVPAASTAPTAPTAQLHRWDEALAAYEGKLHVTQPSSQEYLTALLGKMRCLASLAEWEKLSSLCRCARMLTESC